MIHANALVGCYGNSMKSSNEDINDFSPVQKQAISWANAGLLLIVPVGMNFSAIRIKKYFGEHAWKMAAGQFNLDPNVLKRQWPLQGYSCLEYITRHEHNSSNAKE